MPGGDYDDIISMVNPPTDNVESWEAKDKQPKILSDSGSSYNSGSGGYIQFQPNASGLQNDFIAWGNPRTRIETPLLFTFINYPVGSAQPVVAFKAGTVSLYNYIQLTGAGGRVIVSEANGCTYFVAPWRLLTKRSADWVASEAQDILYAPLSSTSTTVSSNAGLGLMATYFSNEAIWTPSSSGSPNATLQIMANTGLCYLNDVFESLGTKRFNIESLKLFPNLQTNINSPIFIEPSSYPSGYSALPTISINGGVLGSCRLRYDAVIPTSEQMPRAIAAYERPTSHYIQKVQQGITQTATSAVNQLSVLISQSVVRPEQVLTWRLPSTVSTSVGGTTLTLPPTSCFDLFPIQQDQTYALSTVQLVKGNTPYFWDYLAKQTVLGQVDDRDLYQQAKDSSCGTIVPYEAGSQLGLNRWREINNTAVVNCSRDGHDPSDKSNYTNESVALSLQFNVNNGNSVSAPYLLAPFIVSADYFKLEKGMVVSQTLPPKRSRS